MIILMLQMRKLRQTAFTNLNSLPLPPSLFFTSPHYHIYQILFLPIALL